MRWAIQDSILVYYSDHLQLFYNVDSIEQTNYKCSRTLSIKHDNKSVQILTFPVVDSRDDDSYRWASITAMSNAEAMKNAESGAYWGM